jgi:hypothetical protein
VAPANAAQPKPGAPATQKPKTAPQTPDNNDDTQDQ